MSHADFRAVGQCSRDPNYAVLIACLEHIQVFLRAAVFVVVDHGRSADLSVSVSREEYRVLIVVSDLVIGECAAFQNQRSAALGVNT